MKNTLKFILASFCALAFIGCEPAEPELDSNLNKDLTFTLELDEVDATSAKIKVSHNGTKEDTWFGFATTEANPLDAVEDLVAEVLANTSKVSLKKSTQTTYSVKELTPETEYTFVVVGLTAEGVVYGFLILSSSRLPATLLSSSRIRTDGNFLMRELFMKANQLPILNQEMMRRLLQLSVQTMICSISSMFQSIISLTLRPATFFSRTMLITLQMV